MLCDWMTSTFLPQNAILSPGHITTANPKPNQKSSETGNENQWCHKKPLILCIWTPVHSQGEQSHLSSTFRDLTIIFFLLIHSIPKHSEATSGVISLVFIFLKKSSFRVIYYFSLKLNLFSFCTNQTACGC